MLSSPKSVVSNAVIMIAVPRLRLGICLPIAVINVGFTTMRLCILYCLALNGAGLSCNPRTVVSAGMSGCSRHKLLG